MQSKILALAALLPLVSAHGWLNAVMIDGTVIQGDVPNSGTNDSAIRLINNVDPVKGATTRDINCGQDAQIASQVASAMPGSTIAFNWVNGDDGTWVHNTGPMLTYMASCGNVSCDSFDAINAAWFKIDQVGQKDDGSGTWVMADIAAGENYSTTIPSNLASGNYLIRHELIALQIAQDEGGAEFYPSCTQVTVGGNETGTAADSDLVSFPGAYSDTDPGILVNAYDASLNYTFPGPAVATITSSGSSSTNASSNAAADSGNSTSSSTDCADMGSSTETASIISSFATTATISLRSVETNRPRQLSRIMRALIPREAF